MSMRFKEANEKIHSVKDQWHYPILTQFGFIPLDKESIGFVRSYRYQKQGSIIVCTTGCNADYWEDNTDGSFGYWKDLEPHLKRFFTSSY